MHDAASFHLLAGVSLFIASCLNHIPDLYIRRSALTAQLFVLEPGW